MEDCDYLVIMLARHAYYRISQIAALITVHSFRQIQGRNAASDS